MSVSSVYVFLRVYACLDILRVAGGSSHPRFLMGEAMLSNIGGTGTMVTLVVVLIVLIKNRGYRAG